MGVKCEDCNPGIVPQLLGCVRPGEDVSLECSLLSMLASLCLALLVAAAFYLVFMMYQKSTVKDQDKKSL